MARSIDYRSTSLHPADEVYATMVDPDYLQARLERLGGPGAALLEHSADVHGARYRLRHGLDAEHLPAIVQKVLTGDIVIERSESWTRRGEGHYDGEVTVRIPGTPAAASGWMRLADLNGADAGNSELVVHADVTVKVPLIGGKIEDTIAEQVTRLLASETAFTLDYLR
ncbi:DUF2505 domain-containing protein [Pseudonocardia bannensis]|uniref:DUF2505 domain-containing protein n=1 Tax=Pseudonocardia bannensis TaxID=630973 RepID=A0A848DKU8_9PSEU|nr:DUF2505 domain-containing protein [Pseudonocardia bannensis]NMH93318.1 DUF2505 domain-containing protein [Pseudonocardia bannensis]